MPIPLIWSGFICVKNMLTDIADPGKMEKVDAILSSAMETIADVLPTATAPLLREGATAAKGALEALSCVADIDELSPSYAAGRLSEPV
ncbi:hypothetical protein [Azospirillum sp. SYSU D00513]|uniref:hypothetical protein n=1 Tax=Azospirillum sp. SYSU D00513 TaxID=2812561 RepID=UPI001A96D40D|nr:hypothetical protein [Azospirillum sp. SYSU D00513]